MGFLANAIPISALHGFISMIAYEIKDDRDHAYEMKDEMNHFNERSGHCSDVEIERIFQSKMTEVLYDFFRIVPDYQK